MRNRTDAGNKKSPLPLRERLGEGSNQPSLSPSPCPLPSREGRDLQSRTLETVTQQTWSSGIKGATEPDRTVPLVGRRGVCPVRHSAKHVGQGVSAPPNNLERLPERGPVKFTSRIGLIPGGGPFCPVPAPVHHAVVGCPFWVAADRPGPVQTALLGITLLRVILVPPWPFPPVGSPTSFFPLLFRREPFPAPGAEGFGIIVIHVDHGVFFLTWGGVSVDPLIEFREPRFGRNAMARRADKSLVFLIGDFKSVNVIIGKAHGVPGDFIHTDIYPDDSVPFIGSHDKFSGWNFNHAGGRRCGGPGGRLRRKITSEKNRKN